MSSLGVARRRAKDDSVPLLFPLLASRVRLLFPLSLSVLPSHISRDAGRGALKGRDCSGDAEAGAYTGVCGAAAAQSFRQGHMRRNMAANARSVRAADAFRATCPNSASAH